MASNKNDGVQILRALLFIGIIAFHCNLPYTQLLWAGVESFFVISSFFLTSKLSKTDEINLGKTICNRVNRLYPQYTIVIIIAIIFSLIINRTFPFKDVLFHSFLFQNFNWMITGYSSIMSPFTAHTWTLSIEIFLFLIWVVAFKYLKSYNKRIFFCLFMGILSIIYRITVIMAFNDPYITSLCPLAHADAFAVGSLFFYFIKSEKREDLKKKISLLILCVGFAYLVLCISLTSFLNEISIVNGYKLYASSKNYLSNPFSGNIYLGLSFISVGLLYFSLRLRVTSKLCKPLIYIGNMSYTGYLIHWPIKVVVSHFVSYNLIIFIIVTFLTIICSIIIEKTLYKLIAIIKKRKDSK